MIKAISYELQYILLTLDGIKYAVLGFPGGSDGKQYACNAGDPGLIPGLGRLSGEGKRNPLQYSCLENPHGQRSLAGYSPWGHKHLDTTEQLSTARTGLHHLCQFMFVYVRTFPKALLQHTRWYFPQLM